MKKVEAMIRPERMPVVKEKLRQMKIGGMTISTVSGWSKERELHLVIESARTGEHGDGVVFVSTIEQAFNIATLDKDEKVVV